MKPKIKAIIWDLVGVLWREEDPTPRRILAAEFGLEVEALNDLVIYSESAAQATAGIKREDEHWRWVAGQIGIQPIDLPVFIHRYWEGDRFDMNLAGFIGVLKKEYKTSLLSNAWSGTRKLINEFLGQQDIFHEVMISAEVKVAKPDPAIYIKMLNLLNVAPREAIFIDDTFINILSARELGINAIHFHNAGQAMADVCAFTG